MNNSAKGFSLVEMVFAVSLLGVAVMGLSLSIPVAVQSNRRNRVDSEASTLVQRLVEQIIAQPLSATSFVDASGNTVSLAAGGSPLASGKINFGAAAVSGYNQTGVGSSSAAYDLRWNVQALADGAKQFTVAARKKGTERYLLPPSQVSLRLGK